MDNSVKKLLQDRAALEADIKTQIGYFLKNNPEVKAFDLDLTTVTSAFGVVSASSVKIKIEL